MKCSALHWVKPALKHDSRILLHTKLHLAAEGFVAVAVANSCATTGMRESCSALILYRRSHNLAMPSLVVNHLVDFPSVALLRETFGVFSA